MEGRVNTASAITPSGMEWLRKAGGTTLRHHGGR